MERQELERKAKEKWESLKAVLFARSKSAKEKIAHFDYSFRTLALIFLAAVLVGAGVKVAASQTFTIGYEDYKVSENKKIYDVNDMQKRLLESGGTLAVKRNPSGEMCTE